MAHGRYLGDTHARERLLALLMDAFSSCAVLLAAIGIYGILAYSVSLRTQEIGIRQAVGANGSRIFRMVLTDGACFGAGHSTDRGSNRRVYSGASRG